MQVSYKLQNYIISSFLSLCDKIVSSEDKKDEEKQEVFSEVLKDLKNCMLIDGEYTVMGILTNFNLLLSSYKRNNKRKEYSALQKLEEHFHMYYYNMINIAHMLVLDEIEA